MMPRANLDADVLALANHTRVEHGLSTLEPDGALARAAQAHAVDMARLGFFSHGSALAERDSLADRARAAGARFESVGENLALVPALQATAESLMDGWMNSPGHRANLLRPEWERSGVGLATDDAGRVFVAQLFSVPEPLELRDWRIDARAVRWHEFRVEVRAAPGAAIAAFRQNAFVGETRADSAGMATMVVEVSDEASTHHVALAVGSRDGRWIGDWDGFLDVDPDGSWNWRSACDGHSLEVTHTALMSVRSSELVVGVEGFARRPGVLVVDGRTETEFAVGDFRLRFVRRADTGLCRVDVGVDPSGSSYRPVRRLLLDTAAGSLRELESSPVPS